MTVKCSTHAIERTAQRNVRVEDVDFVFRFGQLVHNGGALFVFLGERNIPDEYRADNHFARLGGTNWSYPAMATALSPPTATGRG